MFRSLVTWHRRKIPLKAVFPNCGKNLLDVFSVSSTSEVAVAAIPYLLVGDSPHEHGMYKASSTDVISLRT